MASYTRQQLESWLKTIEIKGGCVLDVGNSQQTIKNRLKIFEPDEYVGLDLEKPHECKVKPDYIFDLNSNLNKPENAVLDGKLLEPVLLDDFDIVFMIEVSEYCWNIYQALLNVNSFLKKGGIFYFSTHFLYPIHQPIKDDSIRLTPRGVEKLLQETGFEIIEMKPRMRTLKSSGHWSNFIKNEGMRPAKEYKQHDWVGCLVKCKKI